MIVTQNPNYTNIADTFFLEEERLRQLFSQKKLDQFVWEVDDMMRKNLKVSPHAASLASFYK